MAAVSAVVGNGIVRSGNGQPNATLSQVPSPARTTATAATLNSTGAGYLYDQPQTIERVGAKSTPASTAADALPASTPADTVPASTPADTFRPADGRPILLYNENCQTCRVLSSWVKRSDLAGEDLIDERPIPADPSGLAQLNPNLDIWAVYEKIHLLMPDGEIKVGGAAIAEVLRRLPSTRWFAPLFSVGVGSFRPFQSLLDVGYNFLDAIRPALGCESCGGGPVAWWAKPIKWAADAVKAMRGKGSDADPA